MKEAIYRNTCPRNCYGTCGILSHVKNGKLIKVTGDPDHGYSKGRLCAKGYAYTEYVYSPNRLKYPMLQSPRGSGNWKRISWDEAYTIIASKMVELNQRYGSNLASGYNKYSGNLGLLHYATEGMFNSMGPHTMPIGNPCALTGRLAMNRSFGENYSSIPEDMAGAKLIVLWGANPAITNVHQMKFIYEARKQGAKLVVIDPVFSQTAQKADLYIQIHPGTDQLLAHGIAKLVINRKQHCIQFLEKQTEGWLEYKQYLENHLSIQEVCRQTGVSIEALRELSELYGTTKPIATWAGLGVQRNKRGSESISAINSLAAVTGNLFIPNGGLYYMHFDVEDFPCALLNHKGPEHPSIPASREVDISDYAANALLLSDPPLKLLWIASRNITQDQNFNAWDELFQQIELIVTVDLYMTKTAERSDIVLPAATHFEEEDLNVGYWHYWLSFNQKAIPPYYEAKSDLQIARELTTKLNELSPGFSNFPASKEPIDWIKEELTPEIMELYSFSSFEELMERPFKKDITKVMSEDRNKFRLFSPANQRAHDQAGFDKANEYKLITPQSLLKIHSQYESLNWLNSPQDESCIELSIEAARVNGIKEREKIEVYNDQGKIVGVSKINPHLPKTIILAHQAGDHPINQLISQPNDQIGSTYFYDSMVKIKKAEAP
ncbi:molybdopterin-dependent oxidoreductase [Bacillus sp. OK048]|uniref:molybdopterin-dependent oxidoreductase n=1 Tax=Bacillus sp. OK048 TaxID=1882761 RepID=UPI0008926534|nr:molybdopterin-dependent oxidoreductase [Bacillus sp. OK048]SDM92047.1 Anaerobic selenocysteine-containing dehydrogenase [Bacillus sp. OK048]